MTRFIRAAEEQIEGRVGRFERAAQEPQSMPWGEVASGAIGNFGSSAAQFGQDMIQPLMHPQDTAQSLYDLGKGILQLAIPGEQGNEEMPRAIGQFFADRYGGIENVKRTMATDPVGLMSDLSMLITGGGTAVAKAPGIVGKVGKVASNIGNRIDPTTLAVKGLAKGVDLTGRGVANVLGPLGTGTGSASIKKAYQAGREGGGQSKAFKEAIRGRDALDTLPDDARAGIARMKDAKQRTLDADLVKMQSINNRLDFMPILDEWADIKRSVQHKGLDKIGKNEQRVLNDLEVVLVKWLERPDVHTPVGMDALKQALGNVSVPDGRDFSRAMSARTRIYNKVKDLIVDQVPEYADAMKKYENASKVEDQIVKTFSLRQNALDETIGKKFSASLRDNVDTNYGKRLELAEILEKQGGVDNLTSRIAGDALGSIPPRGLTSRMVGTANAIGNPWLLPLQSPRLVGELAHGLGAFNRGAKASAKAIGINPSRARNIGRVGFQSGRLKGILDEPYYGLEGN